SITSCGPRSVRFRTSASTGFCRAGHNPLLHLTFSCSPAALHLRRYREREGAMLRNYLKVALHDLRRHPVQSVIAIGGLAIGLAVAIATSIGIVSNFTYNHFIPGYDRIYYAVTEFHDVHGDQYGTASPQELAAYLKQFPEIEDATRVSNQMLTLRHGDYRT